MPAFLHHTCNLLLQEANRIKDSALRHAFMQEVPEHRQLLALAAENFQ